MPIIATDKQRFSNVVKHEYEPTLAFCRAVVTANEATATDYAVGTVLGKITASGKYVVAKETATDGSKVPAAVVLEDKSIAAATDTKVLVAVRGPMILSKAGIALDATYNTDAKKVTAIAALEALGILVNDAV